LEHFPRDKDGLLGLGAVCKVCAYDQNRRWAETHKAERAVLNRKAYLADRENRLRKNDEWRRKNIRHVLDMHNIRRAGYRRDPIHRLTNTMRAQLWQVLTKQKGGRHWETLVGYTVSQLKAHLETQFVPGMIWENYGTAWHVDHIRPIASFIYSSPDDPEFKECWALGNLQPLWAGLNIRKGARWNGEVLEVQAASGD
jgi:hypothetical protein